MFCLQRSPGQSIRVTVGGVSFRINVQKASYDIARLAFDAPQCVRIEREEHAETQEEDECLTRS